jgi:Co/Zn/Cd efflux system component
MDHCCNRKAQELAQLRARESRTLKIVLAINAVMFLIEFTAGVIARATALMADSVDMFGDALVYALSLYVIDRGIRAGAVRRWPRGSSSLHSASGSFSRRG